MPIKAMIIAGNHIETTIPEAAIPAKPSKEQGAISFCLAKELAIINTL